MNVADVPFLRGETMPDQRTEPKAEPKAKTKEPETMTLTPASESGNPAVQQLLAELATARVNGAADDAADIVDYLAKLGFSA